MVKEAVGSDSRLQVEIIKSICNAADLAEALYFAQMYSVPEEEWPWHLKHYANQNRKFYNKFYILGIYSILYQML